MNSLTDPVSYRRQINPTGVIDGTWWVGNQPPLPRRPEDPRLNRWLDVDAVSEIATFCQSRIEAAYGEIAAGRWRRAAFLRREVPPGPHPGDDAGAVPTCARDRCSCGTSGTWSRRCSPTTSNEGGMGFRRDLFEDDAQYVREADQGRRLGAGSRMGSAPRQRTSGPIRGSRARAASHDRSRCCATWAWTPAPSRRDGGSADGSRPGDRVAPHHARSARRRSGAGAPISPRARAALARKRSPPSCSAFGYPLEEAAV